MCLVADPATFDTTAEKLSDFERLIILVDQKVMSGDMFRRLRSLQCMYVCVCMYVFVCCSGIEQDFETAYIQVSNAEGAALSKELFIKVRSLVHMVSCRVNIHAYIIYINLYTYTYIHTYIFTYVFSRSSLVNTYMQYMSYIHTYMLIFCT